MSFIKNAWYVAAWSDEVEDQLFARKILGEHVLLYRQDNGVAVALSDRCPHRFVALHLGKRHGDVVECAYHGLRFDSSGACVLNPNSDVIPKAARLRKYPLVERYSILWIWLGDVEAADDSLIPDFTCMTDGHHATVHGYIHGASSYMLMLDNILDLSHTNYLHADTLGSEALARVQTQIIEHDSYIDVMRWMPNDYQAPLSASSRGFKDRLADSWIDTRWYCASNFDLVMGMAEPGAPRSEGKVAHSLHLITPETEISNHYFWGNARDYRCDDEVLTRQIAVGFASAFTNEDKPILECQQEMMGGVDFWSLKPVLLAGDAAAVRIRRRVELLLEREKNSAKL